MPNHEEMPEHSAHMPPAEERSPLWDILETMRLDGYVDFRAGASAPQGDMDRSAFVPPENPRLIEPLGQNAETSLRSVGHRLATLIVYSRLSKQEIQQFMHGEPHLGGLYPGFLERLRVPEGFPAAHPNIRFITPNITEHMLEDVAEGPATYNILRRSGLLDIPIMDVPTLAQRLIQLQDSLPRGLPEQEISGIFERITNSFIRNLELHRLTKDPEGTMVRFSDTPKLDVPSAPHRPLPEDESIFRPAMHPSLRPLATTHWTTWWHRQNINPTHEHSHAGGRQPIYTTVAELEQNHIIALDTATPLSLIAFRNRPETLAG